MSSWRNSVGDRSRLSQGDRKIGRSTTPWERATTGLVVILAITGTVVIGCFWTAQRATDRREQVLMALADDVVRVSQAEVAAERMVVVGRAYLLTTEPEFLARAQAASAKLEQTLQELQQGMVSPEDRDLLDAPLNSAGRYRKHFEELVSDPAASASPRALAESLHSRLLPARDRLEADLNALIVRRQQEETEVRASAADWASQAIRVMFVLGVLGVLASVLVASAVTASLTRLSRRLSSQSGMTNLGAAGRPNTLDGQPAVKDDRVQPYR